jgi:VIT1/CCC1 family predicted Fe2+/Mn2+ transporter
MPETPEGTKPPSPEEILADIRAGLQSETVQSRLNAIQKLGEQKYSSPAILRKLEELASKDKSKAVREAAFQALASPTHRFIQSRTAKLNRKERQIILTEITNWEGQGFIDADQAEVIRQRYDFDLTAIPTEPVSPALPTQPLPAPVKEDKPKPQPEAPRPGLAQTLLSETSIKIALYLGAFFVIAAAAILAALVEAARLPILLVATALFAGGAILTRTRLPQPSFALFIVFSFLLPTDANVLADVLDLSSNANAGYWLAAMAVMALIWSLGPGSMHPGCSAWQPLSRWLFQACAWVSSSKRNLNSILSCSVWSPCLAWGAPIASNVGAPQSSACRSSFSCKFSSLGWSRLP